MSIRYSGNILGHAKVGHVFVVGGISSPGAERFDIWLKNGKADGVNTPLHFSVRFRENIIVRNSMINHRWGAEERDENLDTKSARLPLRAGDRFKVYIFLGNDRFLVSVNDKTYCSYRFRLPIGDIKTIEVSRDVQQVVQVDHRSVFPVPCPTVFKDSPKYDFSNDIPRRFRAGHQIIITGVPVGKFQGQFVVRLFEGDTAKQALHFNPRFVPYNFVAINSQNDDLTWQNEERHTNAFPFGINTQFKLTITLADTEFRFAVNDKTLATYRYRSANLLSRLNGLKIEGKDGVHVQISSIDHIST